MLTIFVDADACPVKDEIYRVARRYALRVVVVSNTALWVPRDPLIELVVLTEASFNIVDDWIAEQVVRCRRRHVEGCDAYVIPHAQLDHSSVRDTDVDRPE